MTAGPESPGSGAAPKVSVAIITYNQERYIGQALASALSQETRFPFEVVVGEDGSKDGTGAIVADFERRRPGQVRVLPTPHNLGMLPNLIRTLRACRGEYVALLEGDDFWTHPAKLQRQVEFLEAHRNCAICFHDAEIRHEDGSVPPRRHCHPGLNEISTIEDLLEVNFIPTCSTVYRNRLFPEFPDWFSGLEYGDWPLHLLNAMHGDIGFIREVWAVYRVHPTGVWSMMSETRKRRGTVAIYEHVDALTGRRHHAIIREFLGEQYFRLARLHGVGGEMGSAWSCMTRGFLMKPLNPRVPLHLWLRLLIRLAIPWVRPRPAVES